MYFERPEIYSEAQGFPVPSKTWYTKKLIVFLGYFGVNRPVCYWGQLAQSAGWSWMLVEGARGDGQEGKPEVMRLYPQSLTSLCKSCGKTQSYTPADVPVAQRGSFSP